MNFQVLEFNGESDRVHALIEYPPKLSISQIVNALKGVSSRRYGQAGHEKPHKEALWSPSYFAVSVGGAPLEVLNEYIRNHEKLSTEEGACIPFFRSILESSTANRKNLGWNCDDTGEEQVVSVDIGEIRKQMIQVDATASGFIKTIRGYGYRFDPPDRTAMAIY